MSVLRCLQLAGLKSWHQKKKRPRSKSKRFVVCTAAELSWMFSTKTTTETRDETWDLCRMSRAGSVSTGPTWRATPRRSSRCCLCVMSVKICWIASGAAVSCEVGADPVRASCMLESRSQLSNIRHVHLHFRVFWGSGTYFWTSR